MMTSNEFNLKQFEKQTELMHGPVPGSQLENDIYNLKYIRYGIQHGSFLFHLGAIESLDRAISELENK